MKFSRRKFLHLAAGVAALPAGPHFAWAQTYPVRPVRLIDGYPPGGSAEITARLIGQWLSERFGQPFSIDSRPGGGGNIATEAVVRAPADGHTLLLVGTSHTVNATLYGKLNFNFVRDIVPVGGIIRQPQIMLINPSVPAKTVPEFIAYAKANPGKIKMASGGNGSSSHLSGELFKMMAGVNLLHVPYRGVAPALADMLGGQAEVYFGPAPATIEHIKSGKLRALAVTTSKRLEVLPDIPTVGEFVRGYEAIGFFGVGAPKKTRVAIVNKLNKEMNAGFADSEMKARIADMGGMVFPGSPADFKNFIGHETEKWGKVIRTANIKQE
jgi:tripartite-type tricarboxylate transporter receptor subunit TctC